MSTFSQARPSPRVFCDMHSDLLIDLYLRRTIDPAELLHTVHLSKFEMSGVNFVWITVGGDYWRTLPTPVPSPAVFVLEQLCLIDQAVVDPNSRFSLVNSGTEAEVSTQNGRIALLRTIEGAGVLEGSLAVLEKFYELGVRSMCLTHRFRNELADGNAEVRTDSGLTGFGVSVVRAMNRLGMLIDISHLTGRAVWDVLRLSTAPVVASHSNAAALCEHPRNLPADALQAVAASGGVVGVNFYPDYLSAGTASVGHVVDQVRYLAELLGIAHVGLGPDFIDYIPDRTDEAARYPLGAASVGEMASVLAALQERGYSAGEIDQIAGENALRVCKDVLN